MASRSSAHLRIELLPCGETEYRCYSIEGGHTFKTFNGMCCKGKCPKRRLLHAARTPGACGWLNVFGGHCPIEATNDAFTWHRWEPRLRGTNDEGKDFYSDEWVPHKGTRCEFLEEIRHAVESGGNPWLLHTWRHKMIRHAIKLHEAQKDNVTATEWSDYAAQPEIRRARTATCANAEKVNELVTVVGYNPYDATVEVPKRGRRPASTTIIRKQHVDVFFAFHATGYRPNARSYNVVQEDIDSFLKFGKVNVW